MTEVDPNAPKRTRGQLWNELKIISITRAFTLIYSLSLLMLFTRIQLNLLGRMDYVRSVTALAQPPPSMANSIVLEDHDEGAATSIGESYDDTRRYLVFCYHLLHKGYAQIMARVRTAVEEEFGAVSPMEALSAERLRDLVLAVRKKVEGANEQERYATRWLPYLLPPIEEEDALLAETNIITPPQTSSASSSPHAESAPNPPPATTRSRTSTGALRQLLDETADLIDSPSFTKIHTLILNTMFSLLIDQKVKLALYPQPNIQSPPASEAGQHPRIQELDSSATIVPAEPRVKLAQILPIVTRQAHAIGHSSDGTPNEYVAKADAEVRELDAFAAVIYTTNLESEQTRPRAGDSESVKSAEGVGVSDVGVERADEMIESQLEGAWAKVTGSTSFPGR